MDITVIRVVMPPGNCTIFKQLIPLTAPSVYDLAFAQKQAALGNWKLTDTRNTSNRG